MHPYHRAPDLGQVLDDLSRSGISVTIDALPAEAGYFFRICNAENSAEGSGETVFDLVLGLIAYAVEHFPDSQFATQYRAKTF